MIHTTFFSWFRSWGIVSVNIFIAETSVVVQISIFFWFNLLRFEVLVYKSMCSFIVCKVCKIYGESIIASICYEVHFCCICICCCEILSNAVTLLVIVLEVVSCFFWFWFRGWNYWSWFYWFWCWSYLFCIRTYKSMCSFIVCKV